MKTFVIVAVALAAIVAAVILPKKSVRAEVIINAEPNAIWDRLMDTPAYGEWNPIFTKVEGAFKEGSHMQLSMTLADGSTTQVKVLVKEMIVNQKLNQTAGIPGVLTADHRWLIEETAEGTKVIQYEEYRGVWVLFYDPAYVQDLYQQGLVSLKERIEKESSNGS